MNAFCEHHQDRIRFGYRCFDRILLFRPGVRLPLGWMRSSEPSASSSPRNHANDNKVLVGAPI
jgi:hypothetical protein